MSYPTVPYGPPLNYQAPPPPATGEAKTQGLASRKSEVDLLWHLCNLLNAVVSCLNTYLSLDPLVRSINEGSLQPPAGTLNAYLPGMQAQARMVHDLSNITSTVYAQLLKSSLHQKIDSISSYRGLTNGATMLPSVVSNLPQGLVIRPGVLPILEYGLPTPEQVQRMRTGCDTLLTLCHGGPAGDVDGWRSCWKSVTRLLEEEKKGPEYTF